MNGGSNALGRGGTSCLRVPRAESLPEGRSLGPAGQRHLMTPGFQLSRKVALLLFILPILKKAEDKACTAGLEESGEE